VREIKKEGEERTDQLRQRLREIEKDTYKREINVKLYIERKRDK
jgi:hypothetical protein